MTFEVEQKFRLSDAATLESRLQELGADPWTAMEQVDSYFAHPSRDFGQTDEALRIRCVAERNYITYKGPKIDRDTKTRREIELALSAGPATAAQTRQMLECLGFRHVADVRKLRRATRVKWREVEFEVSIDDVAQVGLFAEIELLADEAGLPAALAQLAAFAKELELTASERRSYLELLLAP